MLPSGSDGSGRSQQGASFYRHRHDPQTKARLEEIFKECPHPDETRRRQISEELGLEVNQVKFWFQNKKTQQRNESERLDNDFLRLENERMQSENLVMSNTLKNAFCIPCGARPLEGEERELSLQTLKAENILLTIEYERIIKLLSNSGINSMLPPAPPSSHDTSGGSLVNQTVPPHDHHNPAPDQRIPIPGQHIPSSGQHIPILDQLVNPAANQDIPAPASVAAPALNQSIPALDHNIPALNTALDQCIPTLISTHDQNRNIPVGEQEIQVQNHGRNIPSFTPTLHQGIPLPSWKTSALHQENRPHLDLDLDAVVEILNNDMEIAQMSQIAHNAMEELMKLLSMNEPFWFRSLLDGKFILQRDTYQNIFRRTNCLSGPHARIESSKDSRVVNMSGAQLVGMFLNADKWVDLFPTMVTKAKTIQVFESGLLGNRNGALQLMNAEMHILSHLVPTREFHFLRYCKQIEEGVWAIGDVSVDSSDDKTPFSRAWRFPSGCLIQETTQGLCRVSWVEHVEVDDKNQTHEHFWDVICRNNAYGAERWVLTLERMCQRFACLSVETIPSCDAGGVIRSPEGRRSIMHMAHRMVKSFCGILEMQDNTNFPHLTRKNNNGIRVSVRMNNTEPDVPKGMIVSAATAFWLPLSPQNVYDFLIDTKERAKWDVLCYGSEGHKIQHISTGSNPPGNCISIMRPFIPIENNIMILQESYADALGSMLVYAPFNMEAMNVAFRGEDISLLPILPCGFTISSDGQSNVPEGQSGQVGKSGGSLVTLMLQLLACSPSRIGMVDNDQIVGTVNTIVTSTVEKIKVALNCSNL